jgi:hypothetical protein
LTFTTLRHVPIFIMHGNVSMPLYTFTR